MEKVTVQLLCLVSAVCVLQCVGKFFPPTPSILSSSHNNVDMLGTPSTRNFLLRGGEHNQTRFQKESGQLLHSSFSSLRIIAKGVSKTVDLAGSTAATFVGGGVKLVGAAASDISDTITYVGDKLDNSTAAGGYIGGAFRLASAPLRAAGEGLAAAGAAVEESTQYGAHVAGDAVRLALEGALATGEALGELALGLEDHHQEALDEAYFGGESHADLQDDPTKRGGGVPAATGAVGVKDSQEPVSAVSRVFGQRRRSNTQLPSTMAGGKTKRGPLPLLRLAARNLVFTNCGSVRSVYHFAALYSIFKALLSKFKFGKRMKIFLGLVALLHELSRESAVQERAREAARLDLLGQDPASGLSVQYPTWLNSVLQEVWPSLEPNLSASIGAAISTSVAKDPDHDNYTFVGISDFTLGSTPPLIRYVSVLTQPNAHLLAARPYNVSSVALSHFRNNTNDGKRFVYAELGLDYRGKDSQISVKMGKTKIRKKAWWESDRDVRRRLNKSYIPTSATIVLSSVVVQMKVVLAMELSKNLEPDYLFLSFVETPRIRFGLKPLGAFDLTKLPGLGSGIQYGIERVLRGFTSPAYYELDLLTAEEKAALRDSVLQDIVDMASGGASGGTLKSKPKKRKAGHQHQQRRQKRVDKDKRDPHGVVSDKEENDALNYDPRLVWKNEKDSPRRVKKQKSQQQQQQQQSMKQKSSSKKAMLVEECTFGTAVKNQKIIELEKDHIVQQQSPDSVKKFQNVQQSNKDHQQGLLATINVVPYLL